MDLSKQIKEQKVPEGCFSVCWLGQAGFLIKTDDATIAVDPYFSDCCERCFGFKRLFSSILTPQEIIFDALIVTHAHYDHFDVDSMPELLDNGYTRLFSAEDGRLE